MKDIQTRLEDAEQERKCMAAPAKEYVAGGRTEQNISVIPPTFNISNGNVILEPYIRVEDYDDDSRIQDNLDYVETIRRTWSIAQQDPDFVANIRSTEGVVNIDHWDALMEMLFGPAVDQSEIPNAKAPQQTTTSAALSDEDCGDDLPISQPITRAVGETPIPNERQLRDFFKSLHYGLRISYLSPPGEWSTGMPTHIEEDFSNLHQRPDSKDNKEREKTYHLIEKANNQSRNIYLTPLTSVEVPINMFTKINDLFPFGGFKIMTPGEIAEAACGGPDLEAPEPADVEKQVGYFRYHFGKVKYNTQNEPIPLSSPRELLQKDLLQTDEYALLFKYIFSLDRMLSLTHIYSATYLDTLPDMSDLFAPTKENLMIIFLNSLRSGKWADACQIGNKELLDALLNGLTPPWAALLAMTLKFPLKIFKAYMETADINIAISKNIQKVIKTLNGIIATAQRQANAAKRQAEQFAASAERIAGMRLEVGADCGFGLHSPESTLEPQDDLFDPVDETFLYEPETWMIGLSLVPWTIFAPWLWGPPITPVTGWMYWALDDSHVNWLDAIIDDFISKLQKEDEIGDEFDIEIDEKCDIDYGVEFGLGDGSSDDNDGSSGY